MSFNGPVSEKRLEQIARDACESAIGSAETYHHDSTPTWNGQIIDKIIAALVSESTPENESQPPFKYAVNSTIVQYAPPNSSDLVQDPGRRGLHSAAGAYWNDQKDGMWSFKYEGGEKKGMDVVVSVMWFAL